MNPEMTKPFGGTGKSARTLPVCHSGEKYFHLSSKSGSPGVLLPTRGVSNVRDILVITTGGMQGEI